MKKVNMNVDIVDYQGVVIGKLKDAVAASLQQSNKGNPVKMNSWAVNLYVKGEIEIDEADLNFLIEFITTNDFLLNVAKAPAIEILQEAKNTEA